MTDCCGGSKTRLLYACSGCADVGEVADISARELSRTGFGKMSCLAGVGAQIAGFVQSAKGADEVVVIDGCQIACAKKLMELVGAPCTSYVLTDMGLVKGKTEVSQEVVDVVCHKISNKDTPVTKSGCSGGCGSSGCGGGNHERK